MLKKVLPLLSLLLALANATALDLNSATEAELDSIKGVGPGTSSKILQARQQARFTDWPDFMRRVKGIKQQKAAQLSRDGVTVNGAPYPAASAGSLP